MLYFGRNTPGGTELSDSAWQQFVDEVVTPRFPAGLTIWDAAGQWRGASGRVERERSKVLTLLHAGDISAEHAVAEAIAEYKQRFCAGGRAAGEDHHLLEALGRRGPH